MINISLKNSATLIIGGARGIGASAALLAAEAGSDVAWTHLDSDADNQASKELVATLLDRGVKPRHKAVDCANAEQTRAFVEELTDEFGKVDNLIYCAGFTSPVPFLDIRPEDWTRVLDINLTGAFIAARAVIPEMIRAGRGNIVIIGSAAIVAGGGGRADYVSAKAGLEGLSRAITKEFAPKGIRCNIVHPSLIETDLLRQRHPDAAKRNELSAEVPLRRLGRPSDIAGAVIFLISDLASYITAQSLYVDGGRTFCK